MTTREYKFPSREQFHRVVYSIWDFQQSLSALTFLMEECELNATYSKIDLRKFRCYENQAILSFARPFVPSRSGVQLNCKSINFKFGNEELRLKDQITFLRNKIVAHSDSEEMHYKGFTVEMGERASAPFFMFDEGLHLTESQRFELAKLLNRLIGALTKYTFELCKLHPEEFDVYKRPSSMPA